MDLISRLCTNNRRSDALTLLVLRTKNGNSQIIATGSYFAEKESHTAEVAFAVDDAFHGKGLGTLLLERLALLAVGQGFTRFWAVTHAENRAMRDVFRESGFTIEEHPDGSSIEVDLSVVPSEASVARSEMRDRVATTASLRPFFRPRAVAVIGASRNPSSIGNRLLDGLIKQGFAGPIYPVNPKAAEIAGLRSYSSTKDLPDGVDLAVISVPKGAVLEVIDQCAARGVRAVVIITAGFAETGREGRELQTKLVEKVRGYGMRMVGPNCLGLLNADPTVRLNASFSPIFPPPGKVAMSSQSGALGLGIIAAARRFNLGLSTFVSVGNKADVSSNDLLQYWEEDPGTKVILLYLESFGNPRRFARIARRVGRRKPIICVKGGRTQAGQRAAGSHTAALAASDVAVDALFHQTGVIRAETLEEMFDLASTLATQPLPKGNRVAILTNAGGLAILCADTCEAGGLTLPELSLVTRDKLAAFLPKEASIGNPVDMIASATPESYRQATEVLLTAEEIDALIVINIPVSATGSEAIHEAIKQGVKQARAAGATSKTVSACLMTEMGERPQLLLDNEAIPTYSFPEAAARVMGKVANYATWRAQPLGIISDFLDLDIPRAREICRTALAERGEGWLGVAETLAVLQALRLPAPAGGLAKTAEEAVALAESVGYPVVVKLASNRLVHKTELGGVLLNLADAEAVRRGFEEIKSSLQKAKQLADMEGVLVQPMVQGGTEVMAGVMQDPLFGPIIAFGLGGIHVEVLKDVSFRVTPLTDRDAAEMVRSIRGYRLLQGYRGHRPADITALEELLLRISRLVEQVSEISELDLNPIMALPPGEGYKVVDARIRVRAVKI
jgi:acetyl coenzyme A synthetase (ADP forming)-like protein